MREQRAQHTLIPRRASATTQQQSTPRRRDILPASRHQVGHFVGMHPEDQPYQTRQQRASYGNSFNAADAGEQDEGAFMHPTRMGTSARHLGIAPYNYGPPHTMEAQEELQPRRRLHWLARLGIMLTLVLLGWLLLSEAAVWTQHALDTWHYGYPRTYQTDAVVGHGDSLAHPSHFIAINLDGHLEVIELSGGDPKRAHIYVGPTLSGDGRDEIPVTLSFQDVNGDGKPDLVILFNGIEVVYLNTGTTFQPSTHP